MRTITRCRKCGSKERVMAGKVNRIQRYKCTDCNSRYMGKLKRPGKKNNMVDSTVKLYLLGMSIRGIAEYQNVSHTCIIKRLQKSAEEQQSYLPLHVKNIEMDELTLYVGKKERKRWLWIAMCRESGRILAWQLGGHGKNTLKKLYYKIEPIKAEKYHTDKYAPYKNVLPKEKHNQRGGCTNHIEGLNSVLRHNLARFRRRGKCYSKSERMLDVTMQLMMHKYNDKHECNQQTFRIVA